MIITRKFSMMIAAAAIVLGAVAFKTVESKQAELWYEVTIPAGADPNDTSNQHITSSQGDPNAPVFPCNETAGEICSVMLELDESDDIPNSVAEAESLGLIKSRSYKK